MNNPTYGLVIKDHTRNSNIILEPVKDLTPVELAAFKKQYEKDRKIKLKAWRGELLAVLGMGTLVLGLGVAIAVYSPHQMLWMLFPSFMYGRFLAMVISDRP